MINKLKLSLFTLLMLVAVCAHAQRATALRINEVMVDNKTNLVDDYGLHGAWVEIFNTSFATVDIRGCFLTNDTTNIKMYAIPSGDVLTKIQPRQHLLFWVDGMPNRGTFHTNFTLDTSKENVIALYNSNGKDLIDMITVPMKANGADLSWARSKDGLDGWVVKGLTNDPKDFVSPSTNNITLAGNSNVDSFKKKDPIGLGMTLTAMLVVFSALLILFRSFKGVGEIAIYISKRNAMKAQGIQQHEHDGKLGVESAEVYAVIALALHEAQEDVHDIENTILTMSKVQRSYSPWSSKIYTLRQTPGVKH